MCQLWQASYLQQKVEWLEAKSLQKIELVVASLKAKNLYDILQVARAFHVSWPVLAKKV